MKKILLTAQAITLTLLSWSQTLEPKDAGSSIAFKIKNFGVMVNGTITGLKGKIVFNTNNLDAAIFDVTLDANTINTGIDMRDSHLRKPDYFDVITFPIIRFMATKVEPGKTAGSYTITGNLTLKKTTRTIKFPFTFQQQNTGSLFQGGFRLNRRDFDIGGGSFSMADELVVELKVLASSDKP